MQLFIPIHVRPTIDRDLEITINQPLFQSPCVRIEYLQLDA